MLARREARVAARRRLSELEDWCRTVAANVGEMTYDQRRLALDALGVRVRVWQADHEPRYKIDSEILLGGDPSAGKLVNSLPGSTDRCYFTQRDARLDPVPEDGQGATP